jgi:hypothetical protein
MAPLANFPDAARSENDFAGSRDAARLIFAQGGRHIGRIAETRREHDRIFDGLAAALAQIWRHGVRRVAQQRNAILAPARKRRAIVNVISQDGGFGARFNQLLDRILPAAEQMQQMLLRLARGISLALRGIRGGKPIDSAVPHGNNTEPAAASPYFARGEVPPKVATERQAV